MSILITILLIILFVVFSGLIICKTGHASTWEEGIKTLFRWAKKAVSRFIDWLNANDPNARQQVPGLMLTLKEIAILIGMLLAHPYDTLSVEWMKVNSSDVLMLKIGAFGLVERYANLKPAEIREIVCRVVSNFFASQRETIPYFYVPYARQDGFLLLIPLSEYGKQALNRKIEEAKAEAALNQARASAVVTPLTEAVPEDDSEAQE